MNGGTHEKCVQYNEDDKGDDGGTTDEPMKNKRQKGKDWLNISGGVAIRMSDIIETMINHSNSSNSSQLIQ